MLWLSYVIHCTFYIRYDMRRLYYVCYINYMLLVVSMVCIYDTFYAKPISRDIDGNNIVWVMLKYSPSFYFWDYVGTQMCCCMPVFVHCWLRPSFYFYYTSLLVAASVFQDFSAVVNWLRHTADQFAERSSGWMLASVNAVLNTAGLAIITYGVIRGLL